MEAWGLLGQRMIGDHLLTEEPADSGWSFTAVKWKLRHFRTFRDYKHESVRSLTSSYESDAQHVPANQISRRKNVYEREVRMKTMHKTSR